MRFKKGEYLDISNQTYGYLTVLKIVEKRTSSNNGTIWNCICKCGKMIDVPSNRLRRGITKSCGCLYNERNKEVHRVGKGVAGLNLLFCRYKACAKKRNLKFELNKKEFKHITSLECYYCGAKPKQTSTHGTGDEESKNYAIYTYNGIDRIDNNLGYTIDNCVPCCKTCNSAKMDLTILKFLDWVKQIFEYQTLKNKKSPGIQSEESP